MHPSVFPSSIIPKHRMALVLETTNAVGEAPKAAAVGNKGSTSTVGPELRTVIAPSPAPSQAKRTPVRKTGTPPSVVLPFSRLPRTGPDKMATTAPTTSSSCAVPTAAPAKTVASFAIHTSLTPKACAMGKAAISNEASRQDGELEDLRHKDTKHTADLARATQRCSAAEEQVIVLQGQLGEKEVKLAQRGKDLEDRDEALAGCQEYITSQQNLQQATKTAHSKVCLELDEAKTALKTKQEELVELGEASRRLREGLYLANYRLVKCGGSPVQEE